MPYCVENNISIIAYSSLAQGLLTGKFGPDHKFAEGDHRAKNTLFSIKENYERVQTALEKLRPIAEKKQCNVRMYCVFDENIQGGGEFTILVSRKERNFGVATGILSARCAC